MILALLVFTDSFCLDNASEEMYSPQWNVYIGTI